MKKNLMGSALMLMALAAVVFTSCSKDEGVEDNSPKAVRFTSAISEPGAMTKAAGASWAANDKVGIFMVDNGTTTIAEDAVNRQYTTTGSNSFAAVSGNEIYYPVDATSAVDFIAYYPFITGQTLAAPYPVNVAVQTSQAAIDLLYSNNAVNKTKANTSVAMNFEHKLSKVIINALAGDGVDTPDFSAMTVTIKGMNTAAPFDLKTGSLGVYSAPADIMALPAPMGSKYEAIVLPATFAVGELTMDFALNNALKNEVFKRVNAVVEDFEPGKVYTYNVTVKRTGVTMTCTITDWEAAPARTGDAE